MKKIPGEVWIALAFGVLFFGVATQSIQSKNDLWKSQFDNCLNVTQPALRASAERDSDMASFALAAYKARRAAGDFRVAHDYELIQRRASDRAIATLNRATVPCSVRFPKPPVVLIPHG